MINEHVQSTEIRNDQNDIPGQQINTKPMISEHELIRGDLNKFPIINNMLIQQKRNVKSPDDEEEQITQKANQINDSLSQQDAGISDQQNNRKCLDYQNDGDQNQNEVFTNKSLTSNVNEDQNNQENQEEQHKNSEIGMKYQSLVAEYASPQLDNETNQGGSIFKNQVIENKLTFEQNDVKLGDCKEIDQQQKIEKDLLINPKPIYAQHEIKNEYSDVNKEQGEQDNAAQIADQLSQVAYKHNDKNVSLIGKDLQTQDDRDKQEQIQDINRSQDSPRIEKDDQDAILVLKVGNNVTSENLKKDDNNTIKCEIDQTYKNLQNDNEIPDQNQENREQNKVANIQSHKDICKSSRNLEQEDPINFQQDSIVNELRDQNQENSDHQAVDNGLEIEKLNQIQENIEQDAINSMNFEQDQTDEQLKNDNELQNQKKKDDDTIIVNIQNKSSGSLQYDKNPINFEQDQTEKQLKNNKQLNNQNKGNLDDKVFNNEPDSDNINIASKNLEQEDHSPINFEEDVTDKYLKNDKEFLDQNQDNHENKAVHNKREIEKLNKSSENFEQNDNNAINFQKDQTQNNKVVSIEDPERENIDQSSNNRVQDDHNPINIEQNQNEEQLKDHHNQKDETKKQLKKDSEISQLDGVIPNKFEQDKIDKQLKNDIDYDNKIVENVPDIEKINYRSDNLELDEHNPNNLQQDQTEKQLKNDNQTPNLDDRIPKNFDQDLTDTQLKIENELLEKNHYQDTKIIFNEPEIEKIYKGSDISQQDDQSYNKSDQEQTKEQVKKDSEIPNLDDSVPNNFEQDQTENLLNKDKEFLEKNHNQETKIVHNEPEIEKIDKSSDNLQQEDQSLYKVEQEQTEEQLKNDNQILDKDGYENKIANNQSEIEKINKSSDNLEQNDPTNFEQDQTEDQLKKDDEITNQDRHNPNNNQEEQTQEQLKKDNEFISEKKQFRNNEPKVDMIDKFPKNQQKDNFDSINFEKDETEKQPQKENEFSDKNQENQEIFKLEVKKINKSLENLELNVPNNFEQTEINNVINIEPNMEKNNKISENLQQDDNNPTNFQQDQTDKQLEHDGDFLNQKQQQIDSKHIEPIIEKIYKSYPKSQDDQDNKQNNEIQKTYEIIVQEDDHQNNEQDQIHKQHSNEDELKSQHDEKSDNRVNSESGPENKNKRSEFNYYDVRIMEQDQANKQLKNSDEQQQQNSREIDCQQEQIDENQMVGDKLHNQNDDNNQVNDEEEKIAEESEKKIIIKQNDGYINNEVNHNIIQIENDQKQLNNRDSEKNLIIKQHDDSKSVQLQQNQMIDKQKSLSNDQQPICENQSDINSSSEKNLLLELNDQKPESISNENNDLQLKDKNQDVKDLFDETNKNSIVQIDSLEVKDNLQTKLEIIDQKSQNQIMEDNNNQVSLEHSESQESKNKQLINQIPDKIQNEELNQKQNILDQKIIHQTIENDLLRDTKYINKNKHQVLRKEMSDNDSVQYKNSQLIKRKQEQENSLKVNADKQINESQGTIEDFELNILDKTNTQNQSQDEVRQESDYKTRPKRPLTNQKIPVTANIKFVKNPAYPVSKTSPQQNQKKKTIEIKSRTIESKKEDFQNSPKQIKKMVKPYERKNLGSTSLQKEKQSNDSQIIDHKQITSQPSSSKFVQMLAKRNQTYNDDNIESRLNAHQNFMQSLNLDKETTQKFMRIPLNDVYQRREQNTKILNSSDSERLIEVMQNNYVVISGIIDIVKLSRSSFIRLKRYKNNLYYGEIFNNHRHGHGILIQLTVPLTIYEGTWQNNLRFGRGFQMFQNGNVYNGQFMNGKPEGFGCFFWQNGDIYTGQWLNGLKHGAGLWTGGQGDEYLGEWKEGTADGYGIHKWINGDKYQGEFRNSLKHGMGDEKFANGDHYCGEYKNGKPCGSGMYKWAHGSEYKGQFCNGLRHGTGNWKRIAGNKLEFYEGQWMNDRRSGSGTYHYSNGSVYSGDFQDNQKHGIGLMRLKDGSEIQGEWQWGKFIQSVEIEEDWYQEQREKMIQNNQNLKSKFSLIHETAEQESTIENRFEQTKVKRQFSNNFMEQRRNVQIETMKHAYKIPQHYMLQNTQPLKRDQAISVQTRQYEKPTMRQHSVFETDRRREMSELEVKKFNMRSQRMPINPMKLSNLKSQNKIIKVRSILNTPVWKPPGVQ